MYLLETGSSVQIDSYNTLIQYLKNGTFSFYMYYGNSNQFGHSSLNGRTHNKQNLNIVFYTMQTMRTSSVGNVWDGISNVQVDSYLVGNSDFHAFTLNGLSLSTNLYTENTVFYIPSLTANYISNSMNVYRSNNFHSNFELINNLGLGQNLEEVQDTLDSIDNTNKEISNTINDSNVDDVTSSLPSDSNNDITESGFTNIFNTIKSVFVDGNTGQQCVFTVPFTNKTITISKETVYGSNDFAFLPLINAFYYFIISVFIVKDVFKKINYIKTGNIEKLGESGNIYEDML